MWSSTLKVPGCEGERRKILSLMSDKRALSNRVSFSEEKPKKWGRHVPLDLSNQAPMSKLSHPRGRWLVSCRGGWLDQKRQLIAQTPWQLRSWPKLLSTFSPGAFV